MGVLRPKCVSIPENESLAVTSHLGALNRASAKPPQGRGYIGWAQRMRKSLVITILSLILVHSIPIKRYKQKSVENQFNL